MMSSSEGGVFAIAAMSSCKMVSPRKGDVLFLFLLPNI